MYGIHNTEEEMNYFKILDSYFNVFVATIYFEF